MKILARLTEVKHTNIVNFISFWHDKVNGMDRVSYTSFLSYLPCTCFVCYLPLQLVFITEYMTSGSLMQFLNKAKVTKNTISEKVCSFIRGSRLVSDTMNSGPLEATPVSRPLGNVPTYVYLPLRWGHPSNQDTLTDPKGGRIKGMRED